MKYQSILKAILVALAALSLAGLANAQVSLRFEPNEPTVGMGETTRVSIWLDEAIDIRTIQLTMAFDNTLLNSLDVGRGALYDALPGSPTFFESYDANSADGQWEGYTVTFGEAVYVTGPGELMYWDVEGVTPGLADISALEVVLADPDAAEIEANFPATTLEVLPPIEDPILDPEPDFTSGTENGVSWSDVGADEYRVQVSIDPGFDPVLDDTGWISGTSHTFTGLTDNQTYFYRVKARVPTPAYESDWAVGIESSTQDNSAPFSAAESLDDYQTSLTFDVPWTGGDATSGLERVELWVDEGSGYVLFDTITDVVSATPFSYTAPGEGSYSFYTIAHDGVDIEEAAPGTADATTTVDVTAPSGDLLINGGATLTNDPAVTLTNSVIDAVVMRYMNEGDTWTDWEPYAASVAWALTGADGLLTVAAEFRDVAGNVFPTSAAITLDTTPPVDSFVINNDDALTNTTAVTLTNSGSDADQMRFTNVENDWSAPESGWQSYAATFGWDIATGEGPHTVYGQYMDAAGNTHDASDAITLDTVPPAASFVINGDAEYTLGTSVVLTNTSTDAVQMQFSNDGTTYSGWVAFAETQDWTLNATEGANTVHAQFMDAAGNVTDVSDNIILDTTPPTASFVIDGDAAYTLDTAVVLTSTAVDAVQMQFSNDGVTYSGWVDYTEAYDWALGPAEGEQTVYGQYRDIAGNVVSTSDLITLDTTAPGGTLVVNGDAPYATATAVTLDNAVTDAVQMQFSNDGATYSGWVSYAASQSWDLLAVEGEQTVYGQYRDSAGNVLTVTDSIILDTIAPAAAFVINDDEAYALSTTVTLSNTSADAVQMQFSNDGVTYSGWVAFADTYDWTLDPVDGEQTVYGQFVDAAGNVTSREDIITLDTVGPVASLEINGDDLLTNNPDVTLNLTVTGADDMRFSNDGATYSDWVTLADPVDWTLAGADGEQTVFGQFRDIAGNLTTVSDTIILDTTAPEGTFTVNGGALVTSSAAVTLDLAVTGAADMEFSNNGTLWSDPVAYAASHPWTLDGGDGPKTVYGRFFDEAGNALNLTYDIELDTSAPVGGLVINNDDTYTTDPAVTLNLSVTGASEMRFSADGATYTDWTNYAATYPWTLDPGDGSQQVFGQFRDAAGNMIQDDDSIILDTTFPVAGLVINGDDSLTNASAVTLTSSTTGAFEMRFSNDGSNFSEWVPFAATYDWTLAGDDGLSTVTGQYRDEAGNVSSAQDDITLDATAPVGTFVINGGATVTNDPAVSLTLSVTGADQMQFSNDGSTWSSLIDFAGTYDWTLESGDGPKTVHARFVDAAGNSLQLSQDIVLDTTAPSVPVLLAEPAFTSGEANTLAWSDVGAASYYLEASTEGDFSSVVFNSGWVTGTDHTFPGLTDGQIYYYRLKARDDLDNESAWSGSVMSTQDATAPVSAAAALDPFQTSLDFQIPWTGSDATSGLASVELFVNNGGGWSSAGTTTAVDPPTAFEYTAPGEGTYSFYTVATDEAGLVEMATGTADATTTVDISGPAGSFVVNGDAPFATDPAVTLTISVTGADQMQFSNDGSTWSDLVGYADTYPWTLDVPDGLKTVQGRFVDAAGNELAVSDDIVLDTLAPEGTMAINDDAPVTNSILVSLTSDVTGADQMQFSNDGSTWSDLVDFAASYDWTLTAGDGVKTVQGRYLDDAGLTLLTSDDIILDTTAPDIPVLVAEPAFTVGTENTLFWGDIGAASYYLEAATDAAFGAVAAASDWVTGTDFTFTGLADGQAYYYRIKAQDDLGNETDWSGSVMSTQDATAPASTAGPLDSYQTELTFEVLWSGSDATSGLFSVDLFVDDGTGPVLAATTTEVSSPVPFSYTAPGEGTFSFYTVATDRVGLIEEVPGAADATTTVDTTDPTGTMVVNNDEPLTSNPEVTLNNEVVGATEMQFSNDGASYSTWAGYAATQAWTLAGGDGTVTVFARFRDEAGNLLETSDAIDLDTTFPVGTFAINGGALVTSTVAVTLNNDVTGADQMRFTNDDGVWPDYTAYTPEVDWTLTAGDGTKTVFGQFMDQAGNMIAISDDILLDTTAPEVPVLAAEPAFTPGNSNTVTWSSTGAAAYLAEAATDADFTNVMASTDWMASTFYEFMSLSDGQTYYFRAKARDALENESAWSGSVMSTQDATAPASTAGPLAAFQNSTTFEVPWTGSDATSGLASVELFVNDGEGWALFGSTTEVDPPAPFSFTAGGEGTYEFYLVAHDQAGNAEGTEGTVEAATVVDLTAPVGSFAINGGDETTGNIAVVLNSDVTDANGMVEMRFTNTDGDWPDAWAPYADTFDWTLTDGDGLKTVFAQYRDSAGNILATSDVITLDTTPPGLPVLVAEPEFTPGTTNSLVWSDSGAAAYFLQVADAADFGTILDSSGWLTELTFTFTGLSDGQIYHYRIRARDELDNETDWASPVFSTQDAGAPISAADPMPTYQGSADITVSWTGSDATSGLASVELFVNGDSEWVSAGVTTEVNPPEPFVYTAPAAGTYRFYTVATDVAGNEEPALGTVDAYTTVDFSAPAAATSLDANPGLEFISLGWTNPEATDLAVVEVWAALWIVVPDVSAYPEYDDIADEILRPASRDAAAASPEWQLVASLGPDAESFVHSEGMDARGVYYYEIFTQDFAGNFSAPATEGTWATNYLLGDFNNDNAINVFDITTLGATYGTAEGHSEYNAIVDVGPTDDTTGTGVPLTDSIIDFDDLMIVASNYGDDKAAIKVEGSEAPALTWYQVDETSWVLGLLEPCASLKALHLVAQVPRDVAVTVEAGAALDDLQEYFLANIDQNGLDAGFAVLGKGAVLPVKGEILKVTTSTPVDLTEILIQARDQDNQSLAFELAAEPLVVLPKAYRLGSNYPNPFNPMTTIAFDLPEPQTVRLAVYDLKGYLVKELVNEPMAAGSHTVVWNGTDRSGRRVASGVYFYQIQAGPLATTKRMMLVK